MERSGAARQFQALGDEHRLAIVEILRAEPRSVQELADRLPVSRPAVSRHLRVLKEAGIVADAPLGTRRVYSLTPDALGDAVGYLDAMWGDAMSRFKLLADNIRPRGEP